MQQGLQQGIRQTAQNLKSLGCTLEVIMKATGLSENEIKDL